MRERVTGSVVEVSWYEQRRRQQLLGQDRVDDSVLACGVVRIEVVNNQRYVTGGLRSDRQVQAVS